MRSGEWGRRSRPHFPETSHPLPALRGEGARGRGSTNEKVSSPEALTDRDIGTAFPRRGTLPVRTKSILMKGELEIKQCM